MRGLFVFASNRRKTRFVAGRGVRTGAWSVWREGGREGGREGEMDIDPFLQASILVTDITETGHTHTLSPWTDFHTHTNTHKHTRNCLHTHTRTHTSPGSEVLWVLKAALSEQSSSVTGIPHL